MSSGGENRCRMSCGSLRAEDGKPREECGIYGIFGSEEAANFTYLGLYSLQHRGQDAAGIVTSDSSLRSCLEVATYNC